MSGGGRAIMGEVYRSECKVLDLLRVREKLINILLFPLIEGSKNTGPCKSHVSFCLGIFSGKYRLS